MNEFLKRTMNINVFLKRTMPFCKNDIRDIIHTFYTCPISHNIVKQIEGELSIVLNDYGENLELCTHLEFLATQTVLNIWELC